MKKIMIGLLAGVSSVALYAAPQNAPAAMAAASNGSSVQSSDMMVVSNNASGSSQVSMTVVSNPGQAPQVVINLATTAMLSIYDQNGNMAFTQKLQPGQTTVDMANFPLGNDQLVVSSDQPGTQFSVTKNVTVNALGNAVPAAGAGTGPQTPQNMMGNPPAQTQPAVPASNMKAAPVAKPVPRTVAVVNS